MLKSHSTLLDLLEIPVVAQLTCCVPVSFSAPHGCVGILCALPGVGTCGLQELLEKCLRADQFQDAMLLHDHLQMLTKANPNVAVWPCSRGRGGWGCMTATDHQAYLACPKVLDMIVRQTEEVMRTLLGRVLNRLSGDLNMVTCVKMMLFIRRWALAPPDSYMVRCAPTAPASALHLLCEQSRLHILSDKEQRLLLLEHRKMYLNSVPPFDRRPADMVLPVAPFYLPSLPAEVFADIKDNYGSSPYSYLNRWPPRVVPCGIFLVLYDSIASLPP